MTLVLLLSLCDGGSVDCLTVHNCGARLQGIETHSSEGSFLSALNKAASVKNFCCDNLAKINFVCNIFYDHQITPGSEIRSSNCQADKN